MIETGNEPQQPALTGTTKRSKVYLDVNRFVQVVTDIVDNAEGSDVAALKADIKAKIADAVATVQVRLF